MDVESLLRNHGDEHPSGENLEYDPAFTEMELAAQPGEERQKGDEILAAEDPDYREVAKTAEAIMTRSHDLRAGVFYAEAVLRTRGLVGFAEATAYLHGCLDQYWDSCHPQLDEDDDDDPTMRVNSMQELAGVNSSQSRAWDNKIMRGLRYVPLTDSRTFGKLSFRDISIAEGAIAAPANMEGIPDSASVAAAFEDTDDEFLAAQLAAAQAAAENVAKIDAIFDDKTPGLGPDFSELIKLLGQIVARLADAGGVVLDGETDAPEAAAGTVPATGGGGGAINSPTDVANALDRIMAYYQRSEPSSPVPLLLKRAKRLVGADFMKIMMDMAPGGVQNVNLIGGMDDD